MSNHLPGGQQARNPVAMAGLFALLGLFVLVLVVATDHPNPDRPGGDTLDVTVDPDHAGDPRPVITVDPATQPQAFVRVVSGTDLHVQGEGFVPGEEVSAGVCIRIDGGRHCQSPIPHHTTADDTGAIDTTFRPEPFAGFDHVDDCRAHQCWVVVSGDSLPDQEPLQVRFALDP